jgi:hypothetical protein
MEFFKREHIAVKKPHFSFARAKLLLGSIIRPRPLAIIFLTLAFSAGALCKALSREEVLSEGLRAALSIEKTSNPANDYKRARKALSRIRFTDERGKTVKVNIPDKFKEYAPPYGQAKKEFFLLADNGAAPNIFKVSYDARMVAFGQLVKFAYDFVDTNSAVGTSYRILMANRALRAVCGDSATSAMGSLMYSYYRNDPLGPSFIAYYGIGKGGKAAFAANSILFDVSLGRPGGFILNPATGKAWLTAEDFFSDSSEVAAVSLAGGDSLLCMRSLFSDGLFTVGGISFSMNVTAGSDTLQIGVREESEIALLDSVKYHLRINEDGRAVALYNAFVADSLTPFQQKLYTDWRGSLERKKGNRPYTSTVAHMGYAEIPIHDIIITLERMEAPPPPKKQGDGKTY